MGNRHLYTIWNPTLFEGTLDEHVRVLINECLVKWLILYDIDITFKNTLDDNIIKKINKQAKRIETLLYIQCLNIFYNPLWVGKVERIEKIKDKTIDEHDPLIPEYYQTVISDKELEVYYSVTLSDLRETKLDKILNLIPSKKFQSQKFYFPFPCLVYQKKFETFFQTPSIDKFNKIEIVYEYHKLLKEKRWFVKKPVSFKKLSPLTIGNEALNLIELFSEKPHSGKAVNTIMKKLNKNKSNIQNYISTINRKFLDHYGKKIIKLESGNYKLKANKIIIRKKI